MLGASHKYEDSDSQLVDQTRLMSRPCHFIYGIGPSASSAGYFTDQHPPPPHTHTHTHTLCSCCSVCTRPKHLKCCQTVLRLEEFYSSEQVLMNNQNSVRVLVLMRFTCCVLCVLVYQRFPRTGMYGECPVRKVHQPTNKNETPSQCSLGSLIPMKCHYFAAQFPGTLVHLSHFETSLKTPSP
jgi:hypothetical protein